MIFIPRDFISCKLDLIQRITPISKQIVRSWHFVISVFYCYTKKGKRGWISMFQVFVSFKIAIDVSLKDSNNSFKGGIFQILFQLHSLHHFFFLIFIMKKIYTSRAYVKLKWRDIVFSLNKKIPVFEFSTLMWKDCTLYTVMIN